MKKMLTAVASVALLTTACSGRDVDIGNGFGKVGTDPAGTSATTGGDTGTTGGGGTTAATGDTTGSSGMTSGSAVTTGGSGMTSGSSAVTTGGPTTVGTTGGTPVATTATTGSGGASGTTGGSGGLAGTGAGGSSGVSGPATAIVIRYGDIPVSNPPAGTSGTSSTGGTPVDPDTPYLIIGNAGPTCGDPMATQACGEWRVTIGIPRALFQPGVLRLGDTRLISVESMRGPDRGGGDCSGGGGSFIDGTVEIVDIGPTVHVRLADTFKLDFNADGAYAATNCQ